MYGFEFNSKDYRVEIHADSSGLLALADYFTYLAKQKDPDSIDLMISSWGGEMNEKPQGIDNEIIKHVKVCSWHNFRGNEPT